MPICLDPNDTFEVVLDSDKNKPEATRPVFLVKAQSIRQQRALSKWYDDLDKALPTLSVDEVIVRRLDKLSGLVTGWKNIPQEFSREAMEDVLEHGELRELLLKIYLNAHLTPEEKKSSES